MKTHWTLAAALAIIATGCNQLPAQISQATQGTPQTGLAIAPLTIERDGTNLPFSVEIAATHEQQMTGMMFRKSIGNNEGMIVPVAQPQTASFWMRNALIPLDIIFIGTDRRILNIAANAIPRSEEPLPSHGHVSAVLEIRGGRAAELGIAPGALVRW